MGNPFFTFSNTDQNAPKKIFRTIVTKLKNSNTRMVTKLRSDSCDSSDKDKKKSVTIIIIFFSLNCEKNSKNLNSDKTFELKL